MDEQLQIAQTLQAVLPDLTIDDILNKLERPKDSEHGDFAFPTFFLAKTLRKAPQMIAGDLIAQLDTTGYQKVEQAGPYINFYMDQGQVGANILTEILQDPANYGRRNLGHNAHVTMDYSSPNIAKPMGWGIYVPRWLGKQLPGFWKKNIINQSGLITLVTGEPNLEDDGRLQDVGGRWWNCQGPN